MSNVKAYLEDIVRDGLHDIAEALKGGGPSGDVQASHVIYDNTASGLTSNRVQGAIDELSTKVDTNASGISDLTTRMGTAESDITSLDGRLDTAEGDITALETWKDNLDASDIPYDSGTVKDALDSSAPKTDIATVESGSTASRAYSVGELVYVNGNLYKVITAIASGATFTVGTNIQSTNVSGTVKEALDNMSAEDVSYGSGTVEDALNNINANGVAHNGIYRGKYLGNSVTAEQWSQISSGKFDDLYIGDYWTINGVNWRIAHFDYWLYSGDVECTTHHVAIVPDSNLYTAQMNTTNISTRGYYNSVMRGGANYPSGGNLASAVTTVTSAFGASHLLTHRNLLTNTISGDNASNWAWYDSSVELMSEVQVYGFPAWSVGGKGYEVGIDKEQLALFKLDHSKITNRSDWWLRSVASSASFCFVGFSGFAGSSGASNSDGVRPVFAII